MRTPGPWHVVPTLGPGLGAGVLGVNPHDADRPPIVARNIANQHDLALIVYAPEMYDILTLLTMGGGPQEEPLNRACQILMDIYDLTAALTSTSALP